MDSKTIILLLLSVLILTGCGETTKIVRTNVPEELLRLEDEPVPPKGEYSQADVGEYTVELYDSLRKCTLNIEAIKAYQAKLERAESPRL